MIWSFGAYFYGDPKLAAWAQHVAHLLASVDEREVAYRLHLKGEELEDALRNLERERRRAERDRRRKERAAEFEATYFGDRQTRRKLSWRPSEKSTPEPFDLPSLSQETSRLKSQGFRDCVTGRNTR